MRHSESIYILPVMLLIVGNFHFGYGIKCYECLPNDSNDCNSKPQVDPINCTMESFYRIAASVTERNDLILPVSNDVNRMAFECVKIQGKENGKLETIRNCVLTNIKICDIIEEAVKNSDEVHNTHCSVCNTDGCNSAGICYICLILLVSVFFLNVIL